MLTELLLRDVRVADPPVIMRSLVLLLLTALPAVAQTSTSNPESSLRFLAATAFREPSTGKDHAYLVWQAQQPQLLQGKTYRIEGKTGDPNSTAPYSFRGTMQFQTNVAVLNAIVSSVPPSVAHPAEVDEEIDELFGDLLPDVSLTLADKLSGVLLAAQADPAVFRRLLFISRNHPLIGVAMGTAAVIELNAPVTTLEVRSQADGANRPGAAFDVVAARVTLDLASPPVIPAPPAPVHVTDEESTGHLNAKLRWAMTDPLKRATPLTFGFNVYRMNRGFAVAGGYDASPPSPTTLSGLLVSAPAQVKQVNELPVLPTKQMTPAEAADLVTDPDTYFLVDDNGALADGNPPLSDGDQFYYFVAARDLLGRPGLVSPGTLVTICDRFRPLPPERVRVRHAHHFNGTATSDHLEVSWDPPSSGEEPSHYLVYRWTNPAQMVQANLPAEYTPHLVSGIIPHVSGQARYSFTDSGAGAPGVATDLGKTFWYSVRSVEPSACGPLLSANSAPGYGVLRDRKGPLAAGSSITVTRFHPDFQIECAELHNLDPMLEPLFEGPAKATRHIELKLQRVDPRIRDVAVFICHETTLLGGGTDVDYRFLGYYEYPSGINLWTKRFKVFADYWLQGSGYGLLFVGRDSTGKIAYAKYGFNDLPVPEYTQYLELCVQIREIEQSTVISGGSVGVGDPVHHTIVAGGGIKPIEINFTPGAGTREYKLYKRVDDGPLMLTEQAEYDGSTPSVTILDGQLPANSAKVCYFIQYFDEHGNPSPLADLGCLTTTSKSPMPVPILSPVERGGTQAAPTATLRWFCEREGVERFRVYVADGATGVPVSLSSELSPVFASIVPLGAPGPFGSLPAPSLPSTSTGEEVFDAWQTGRVGGNFGTGPNPNEFTLTLNVASGRDYKFYVESVSPAGETSDPSNTVEFTWSQAAAATGPQVPWPARSLPAIDPDFIPDLRAQHIHEGRKRYGVVRIGEVSWNGIAPDVDSGSMVQEAGQPQRTPSSIPNDGSHSFDLYESSGGESVLPFALYRYQVANSNFPVVSGDVVQVSPLIDRLRTTVFGAVGQQRVGLWDPFLDVYADPENPGKYGIYVKDTQGVIEGAKYVYVLVRFKKNGEIDRSVPTNEVTIPFIP